MSQSAICLAGIDEDGENIRPVLKYGHFTEQWLYDAGGVPEITPFTQTELIFIEARPSNPHTEDWVIDPHYRSIVGSIPEKSREEFLAGLIDQRVDAIFGTTIYQHQDWPNYVKAGSGFRSLGTIRVKRVHEVIYRPGEFRWDYRIIFSDEAGTRYRLPVTDLPIKPI